MKALALKLLDYAKYPSTWKGIITAATMVGIKIAPDQADTVATAGVSLVAAIWTFFSDADVKK